MFWYRIEIDKYGLVASRRLVEHAPDASGKPEGKSVFYVTAADEAGADELAFREYHRLRIADRRARYAAESKCRCGRARDGESATERAFKQCPKCRQLKRVEAERAALKLQGITPPPVDKAARFVERRNDEKLELLQEVYDQFQRKTMRQFGEWLSERIAELEPKEAPKLRVVGARE